LTVPVSYLPRPGCPSARRLARRRDRSLPDIPNRGNPRTDPGAFCRRL